MKLNSICSLESFIHPHHAPQSLQLALATSLKLSPGHSYLYFKSSHHHLWGSSYLILATDQSLVSIFIHSTSKVDTRFLEQNLLLLIAITTSVLFCFSYSLLGMCSENQMAPYMYQDLYYRQGTQNIMNIEEYQKKGLCVPSPPEREKTFLPDINKFSLGREGKDLEFWSFAIIRNISRRKQLQVYSPGNGSVVLGFISLLKCKHIFQRM